MKKEKFTVKQNPEEIITTEILAQSIVRMSNGFQKLMNGGLREETITILIHSATGVRKTDIRAILKAIPNLRKRYTTK